MHAAEILSKRVNRNARLRAFRNECRQKLLDLAEDKLIEGVQAGDLPTVRWTLGTLGRDRGYGAAVLAAMNAEAPLPLVQIILPDNGRDPATKPRINDRSVQIWTYRLIVRSADDQPRMARGKKRKVRGLSWV